MVEVGASELSEPAGEPSPFPLRSEPVTSGVGTAAAADLAASSSAHSVIICSIPLHFLGQVGKFRFFVQPSIPLRRVSRNSSSMSVRNKQSIHAGADSRKSSGVQRHVELKPSGASVVERTGGLVRSQRAKGRKLAGEDKQCELYIKGM